MAPLKRSSLRGSGSHRLVTQGMNSHEPPAGGRGCRATLGKVRHAARHAPWPMLATLRWTWMQPLVPSPRNGPVRDCRRLHPAPDDKAPCDREGRRGLSGGGGRGLRIRLRRILGRLADPEVGRATGAGPFPAPLERTPQGSAAAPSGAPARVRSLCSGRGLPPPPLKPHDEAPHNREVMGGFSGGGGSRTRGLAAPCFINVFYCIHLPRRLRRVCHACAI
jgi:hypothetical protein